MMKKLTCHCGGVEVEVSLPNGLKNFVRCNCSICKKKGITMVNKIGLNDLKITKGEKLLKLYQYHSKTAKHYFCTVCGIYTHHKPRSNPNSYCVNAGCLEGVDPFELKDVPIFDGINHPHDKK
jgi:hypothetical protein